MGIAAASAGVTAAGGIAKSIIGAKQASDARKAIENYQRQDLQNVYADVGVSTLGSDLQREVLSQATATGIDALQRGGVRALVGGLGGVQQQNIQQSRQIGADLDRQQQDINRLRASDQANIRGLQEQRENADLAGLGQQLNVGQQNLFSGIGDFAQSASSAAGIIQGDAASYGGETPQVTTAASPTAQGAAPAPNPFGTANNLFSF